MFEGIAEKCRSSADTREVIRAAEDPRPVLWTSESGTPVDVNGVSLDREASVRGRSRDVSCGTGQ